MKYHEVRCLVGGHKDLTAIGEGISPIDHPELVAYQVSPRRYVVTHTASGRFIGGRMSLSQAKVAISALLCLPIQWHEPDPTTLAQAICTQKFFDRVKEIVA